MIRKQKRYSYNPDYAVAPGQLIEEFMESYSLTPKVFATKLGIDIAALNLILKGEKEVSEEIAVKLEEITQITARTWEAIEKAYQEKKNK